MSLVILHSNFVRDDKNVVGINVKPLIRPNHTFVYTFNITNKYYLHIAAYPKLKLAKSTHIFHANFSLTLMYSKTFISTTSSGSFVNKIQRNDIFTRIINFAFKNVTQVAVNERIFFFFSIPEWIGCNVWSGSILSVC